MSISPSGKNLNVVIINVASVTHEWMTFASWYSFFKNAPDANVSFVSQRSSNQIHQLFNWANRLPINYTYYTASDEESQYINKLLGVKAILQRNFAKAPLLCIEPDVILTKPLDADNLNSFLHKNKGIQSENEKIWFIPDAQFILDSIDNYFLRDATSNMLPCSWLCVDAQSHPNPLVTFEKGCGRFVTARWIDKNKGCPFGKAGRFQKDSLTVNEKRIIDLWKKLAPLYKAVF
tara:strand:- start:14526 stop:15227 length:702 start_codon:yes stop_codon:yes gene_type:complete